MQAAQPVNHGRVMRLVAVIVGNTGAADIERLPIRYQLLERNVDPLERFIGGNELGIGAQPGEVARIAGVQRDPGERG
jgi:hypothetical protein